MSLAITAQHTLFKVGSGGSGGSHTLIPECKEVNAPDVKTDLNDVTTHDSTGGFREFLPGLHDGGTISAPFFWRPSNTVHISLRVDAYASTLRSFQCIFPDLSDNTVVYDAYIVGLAPMAKVGMPLDGTINLKVTGLPTWS